MFSYTYVIVLMCFALLVGAGIMAFFVGRGEKIYTRAELMSAVEGEAESWIPIMQAYENNIEMQRRIIQELRRRLNET